MVIGPYEEDIIAKLVVAGIKSRQLQAVVLALHDSMDGELARYDFISDVCNYAKDIFIHYPNAH